MIDVVLKFSKVEKLVVDPSVGVLATARVFVQFPQHRRFVGREKNSMCSVE